MKMQRNVIAFAELNVGQVRGLSSKNMDVNVLSIPTQNNPAHAGIVTHISDKLVVGVPSEPEFLDLQCQLLELAGRRDSVFFSSLCSVVVSQKEITTEQNCKYFLFR